ncbi:MAG: tetratricopeptide repeat protein [Clostridia bacterium]|nr:tetratricopeptide repeat protein [Clostridia bacterium]
MRRIKVFLASSIEDLREDRLEVGDFFRQLNEIYIDSGVHFSLIKCEDYDNSIVSGGKQSQYDEEIRDSELCFFLFYRKAGDYTKHEFDVALEAYRKVGKPKIVTYFKTVSSSEEVYEDVVSFMHMLRTELNHYYNKYEHIDTLKLGILMQVKMLKLDTSEIALDNGEVKVNGTALIKAENVPILRGNKTLTELTKRRREVQQALDKAREEYRANPTEEMGEKVYDLSAQLNSVSKELTEVERDTLRFVSTVFEITSDGRVLTERQKKALERFSTGDYETAQEILEDCERENELERAKNRYEQGKNEIQGYVNEDLLWIEAQKAQGIDTDSAASIIERYEKALALSREHNLDKEFMYDYASFLYDQNNYTQAISVAEELLYYYTAPGSTVDETSVASLNNLLGMIYAGINSFEMAGKYYLSAIEIYEGLVKKNRDAYEPDLATSYNNIGNLYFDIKAYENAEKYYLLSIEIREKLVEKNRDAHEPSLASSYNNIGNLYSAIKAYEKSEKYLLLSIEIRERLVEKNRDAYEPDLAMSYNNIGNLYYDLKVYEKAEKYYLLAIEIGERLVKKNRDAYESSLASSYNNIGNLYHYLKAYEKAEKYYLLAIEIKEKLVEKNRDAYEPDLASSYYNIGNLYSDIKAYENAEKYYLLAIEIRERLVEKNRDANEPDLASSYNNIGNLYY